MGYERLFVFVEGPDDTRFFERVVRPTFEERYDWIRIIEYANETRRYFQNFMKSISSMGASYILTGDFDSAPCITHRKEKLQVKCPGTEPKNTAVVVEEIESWYLAGLNDLTSRDLGVHQVESTDAITKEQFDGMIPRKFDSRIDFMQEILNHYSVEVAYGKNNSFAYFHDKYMK